MRPALAARPAVDFPKPDTVVAVTIDPETGLLANADCPAKLDEYYIVGTEPAANCSRHGGAPLNTAPPPPPLPDADGELPEMDQMEVFD